METIDVRTDERAQLVDITRQVRDVVRGSGVSDGVVHLWSLHTTCGLTVNEGADPDVARDILAELEQLAPRDEPFFRHAEGNSDSHIKTSLMNPGATLLIADGELVLGRWQAVFLAEFDGPRDRRLAFQVIAAG